MGNLRVCLLQNGDITGEKNHFWLEIPQKRYLFLFTGMVLSELGKFIDTCEKYWASLQTVWDRLHTGGESGRRASIINLLTTFIIVTREMPSRATVVIEILNGLAHYDPTRKNCYIEMK